MKKKIQVLSIIGATASGKSNLALAYASQFNGEIISCDSVQIYKYLNIGSAKVSLQDRQKIPHYLVDILEPHEACNAGFWRDHAWDIVQDIHRRGKTPIIVGGTGLYLKALYLGMFEGNSRDQTYREYLIQYSQHYGIHSLYQKLQQLDPIYSQKISPHDSLRIIRALEAIHTTGLPFSQLHTRNTKPDWEWIFTMPLITREQIYTNIEQRVYHMIHAGLIEETEDFINRFGLEASLLNTIGYRHTVKFLHNQYSKEQMIAELILDTKHFAKRQLTLFRSLLKGQKIITETQILKNTIGIL